MDSEPGYFSRACSYIKNKRNKKKYGCKSYYIVDNLENVTEQECIKMDKENEIIYNLLLSKAEKTEKKVKNSALSMNIEIPQPPKPSNRDRFLLWKKRNISTSATYQSEAVLFLNSQNYKLNVHYEAYQAIDLANEVKRLEGIEIENIDLTQNFENLFTNQDQNVLRQKAMYGENNFRSIINNNLRNIENESKNENYFVSADGNILNTSLKNSPSLRRKSVNRNKIYRDSRNLRDYKDLRVSRQSRTFSIDSDNEINNSELEYNIGNKRDIKKNIRSNSSDNILKKNNSKRYSRSNSCNSRYRSQDYIDSRNYNNNDNNNYQNNIDQNYNNFSDHENLNQRSVMTPSAPPCYSTSDDNKSIEYKEHDIKTNEEDSYKYNLNFRNQQSLYPRLDEESIY